MAHKFDPAHKKHLESILRKLLLPSIKILKNAGLSKDDVMIDIGAGIGYFTFPASQIVTESGMIYAVDTSSEMVKELQSRVVKYGRKNIQVKRSQEYDFGIKAKNINTALLSTVLHEVDDKKRMLRAAHSVLKKTGKIIIIEYKKSNGLFGPPERERIGKEDLSEMLGQTGFHDITIKSLNLFLYYAIAFKM